MTFDFKQFLDEGWLVQHKYSEVTGCLSPFADLTNDQRYEVIIELIGHLIEEVVEARMICKRRPWKVDETGFLTDIGGREEFSKEIYDILVYIRCILCYAGITSDEFLTYLTKKQEFNETREDHLTNV